MEEDLVPRDAPVEPDNVDTLLVLQAGVVPDVLRSWLESLGRTATLASLELLADGQLVIQVLPDVDPLLIARVRRTIAQYEDVLRRLT